MIIKSIHVLIKALGLFVCLMCWFQQRKLPDWSHSRFQFRIQDHHCRCECGVHYLITGCWGSSTHPSLLPSFRRWQAPPIRGETQQITLQNTRHRSAFKSLLLNHISRKSDSTFFLFVLFFTKVRAGAETNPSWLSGFVWWSCLSLCQNEKEKENRKVSKTNKKKTVSTEN